MYNNRKQEEELKQLTLVHPNNHESKARKLFPEKLEKSHNPIPGTRIVGAKTKERMNQTLGIYMSFFGPKFNLIPN
ncbi:hypothetical protein GQ457_04G009210 [Hibiscus cannabinus]